MKVFQLLALTLIGIKMAMAQQLVCRTGDADILFLLDASGSVTAPHFAIQQQFAADVASAFNTTKVRFGAMLFSTGTSTIFDIDFYQKDEIVKSLLNAPYIQGATNTHTALTEALDMFNASPRQGATRVVIIITDGASASPASTSQTARTLKDAGIEAVAVGVDGAVQSELQDIASDPSYVFKTNSYQVIQALKDDVIKKSCQASGGVAAPPCAGKIVGTKCWIFHPEKVTQDEAVQTCANNKQSLVEVRTEFIYQELGQVANDNKKKLWAGAQEPTETDWRWISDDTSATLPQSWWASGNPNNMNGNEDCLQMQPNKKLNDTNCKKKFSFVCES